MPSAIVGCRERFIVDLLSANFHAAFKYISNIFSAIGYSVYYQTNYRLGRIIPLNFAKTKSDSESQVQPVGVT